MKFNAGLILTIIILSLPVDLCLLMVLPNIMQAKDLDEHIARHKIRHEIHDAEMTFKQDSGSYGTLAQLVEAKLIDPELGSGHKEAYRDCAYKYEVIVGNNSFEVFATPRERRFLSSFIPWQRYKSFYM